MGSTEKIVRVHKLHISARAAPRSPEARATPDVNQSGRVLVSQAMSLKLSVLVAAGAGAAGHLGYLLPVIEYGAIYGAVAALGVGAVVLFFMLVLLIIASRYKAMCKDFPFDIDGACVRPAVRPCGLVADCVELVFTTAFRAVQPMCATRSRRSCRAPSASSSTRSTSARARPRRRR